MKLETDGAKAVVVRVKNGLKVVICELWFEVSNEEYDEWEDYEAYILTESRVDSRRY